jgi:hypothetical protein
MCDNKTKKIRVNFNHLKSDKNAGNFNLLIGDENKLYVELNGEKCDAYEFFASRSTHLILNELLNFYQKK